MYAYIDRKKKLPVTTLLRAIGYEQDKDILQIFDLAEEVKVNKKNMKAAIGRKLAARVLKSWYEDFVDEDTGEVVSIERNEVIMERETELTVDNIEEIVESGASTVLLHKNEEAANKFTIIFNTLAKDPSNSEKRLSTTFIVSCVMLILLMMPVHAKYSRTCSSQTSVMIWVR